MANGWGGRRPGAGAPKRVGVTGTRNRAVTADARARESIEFTQGTQVSVQATKFADAFVNYPHRLGLGAQNILSSSTASFAPLTRIRTLIEWMYRGQFVCKNAVDVVAEDMTRQGVILTGPMKPKDIKKIERYATQLDIWTRLRSVIKWSRLYGGCLGFLIVSGQRPEDPLRLETVGKGQFKGIMPLDRWMVDPSLELLVTDFSDPQVGKPKFYRVTADAPALPRMKIHHSRVIRLVGNELPYWQSIQENLWGLSVLETIQDRIQAFDIGSAGAAQLIDKSFIRTFKIEGLKELIGSNTIAYEGLQELVNVMRSYQGIEGITLMDTKDEYEGHEHGAFSGIAEILTEFRQQLSGALQIPQTKLFGTSPAGMNATGESDMRNYYDMIKARQQADLLYPLSIVYQLIAQSVGVKWSDEDGIDFKPLWQPTEVEKSQIAKTITETVLAAEEKGTISTQTAMRELKQQSSATGVWTNVTEEDIESAADVPMPAAELAMPGATPPAAPKPSKPAKGKDSWSGSAGAAPTNMGYYNPADPPNVLPKPDVMPSGVLPGARPFEDGAPGPTHMTFHGLQLHVENQRGTMRKSRDPANPWQAIMQADYGYIVGTGSAEGPDEGMDCFIGPDLDSDTVFVINQKDLDTGFFDEHKVCLAFSSEMRAVSAYVSSYSDLQGMDRIMSVHKCSIDEFKKWLALGHLRKPYGEPEKSA